MRLNKADAVVIGAGAAGGVVAKELCSAGLRVVLIEKGSQLKVEEFRCLLSNSQINLKSGDRSMQCEDFR